MMLSARRSRYHKKQTKIHVTLFVLDSCGKRYTFQMKNTLVRNLQPGPATLGFKVSYVGITGVFVGTLDRHKAVSRKDLVRYPRYRQRQEVE